MLPKFDSAHSERGLTTAAPNLLNLTYGLFHLYRIRLLAEQSNEDGAIRRMPSARKRTRTE
ncbi:hypothetical protein QMZ05_40225 [Bradyrhizobium sp. INPA03-11B]